MLVLWGVVAAGVEFAAIISAPDDHFETGPDGGVLAACSGDIGAGASGGP